MLRNGALRIGRVGGVSIDLHLSIFILLIWAAWQGAARFGGLPGAAYGVLVLLLLFGSVLIHELGHALAAQAMGLRAQQITLFPLGGLAHLEADHINAGEEFIFTLAGPLANLGLTLALGALVIAIDPAGFVRWTDIQVFLSEPGPQALLRFAFWVNAALFAFNMLPAFPIDGGRLLRAGLAALMGYRAATLAAVWLGYGFAVLMLPFGLFGIPPLGIPPNLLLAIFGLTIALGAAYEDVYTRRQLALNRLHVDTLAFQAEHTLRPHDPLNRRLVSDLLRLRRSLPVLLDGRVVGLLSYDDIRNRRSRLGADAVVAHFMRTDFPHLNPQDTLWAAQQTLDHYGLDLLPVSGTQPPRILDLDTIRGAWRQPAPRA